jgi:large subunit ribosomal protein L18
MATTNNKQAQREARRARIRARVHGTAERPRLAIFKSNRYIYAQLVNDETGTTVATADSRTAAGNTPAERAAAVGSTIAEKAKAAGIAAIVFDRGGFRYQGAIAALADAARAGGLAF